MGVSIVSPEDQSGGTGSGGLTDAELRASPVPVSTGLIQPLTDAQLRAAPLSMMDDNAGSFLWRILNVLLSPRGFDKSLQRQRGTVVVESGTIGSVTFASNQDIRTVATLTNQTNIGSFPADAAMRSQNNTSWNLNVRARIT